MLKNVCVFVLTTLFLDKLEKVAEMQITDVLEVVQKQPVFAGQDALHMH